MAQVGWQHSYAHLGAPYVAQVDPEPASRPTWLAWNESLAESLNLPQAWRHSEITLEALAGNCLLDGSEPIATVYSGHQFGQYNPQLGDGRAILLGEWKTPGGAIVDIQLKGAGQTPYSRGGDGRSPVGPVVREYLLSEAMHALGVPTTRALAAIATGDKVYRNSAEPGAVLTRVASSHLRVGSLQYFAMTQGGEGLGEIVDYTVRRHYSEFIDALNEDTPATRAQVLLEQVTRRIAALVAHWQSLGFIHGVMNTDNMLLCGETVDYGPCAFMDEFDNDAVFSAIDTQGRYRYANQPGIAHWNMSVFASCLLPILHDNQDQSVAIAQAVVDEFPRWYTEAYQARLALKLGLDAFKPGDQALIDDFYKTLYNDRLDYTLAHRWLTEVASNSVDHSPIGSLFTPSEGLTDWLSEWQSRRDINRAAATESAAAMQRANPVVTPRNHQVARAIAAAESGDSEQLKACYDRWQAPFEWQTDESNWATGPTDQERVTRTFCGT